MNDRPFEVNEVSHNAEHDRPGYGCTDPGEAFSKKVRAAGNNNVSGDITSVDHCDDCNLYF